MTHSERVQKLEAELKAALADEGSGIQQERELLGSRCDTANAFAAGRVVHPTGEQRFDLEHIFSYHSPAFQQLPQYALIRQTARYFAQILIDNTPPSADQTAAIRLLRECVMTANASIALGGRT